MTGRGALVKARNLFEHQKEAPSNGLTASTRRCARQAVRSASIAAQPRALPALRRRQRNQRLERSPEEDLVLEVDLVYETPIEPA